jgi:hypothetical protein
MENARGISDISPSGMLTCEYVQEDVELSGLAQELTRQDKLSPVAWCAAGNCFSHQKEHENAIRSVPGFSAPRIWLVKISAEPGVT